MTEMALVSPAHAELQVIAERNNGILSPPEIVEWAHRHPESHLHAMLEWDDEVAGHGFRLFQARKIIGRVKVRLEEAPDRPIRAYVSLLGDRSGIGYRVTVTVLADSEMRRSLLRQALTEFRTWERKYENLEELAGIFAAADTAWPDGESLGDARPGEAWRSVAQQARHGKARVGEG